MSDIIETADIAQEKAESGEAGWEDGLQTNAVASTEEKPGGISFHVQMRSWTVADMEELVVEAAARIIVGRNGDNKLAKKIEERAITIITEHADKRLKTVAEDVLSTALTPKGYEQKNPVTIGETLAMLGREYLEQKVLRDGKMPDGYHDKDRAKKRIEWIVEQLVIGKFKEELEASSNVFVREVRAEIKARHEAMLATERARIAEALAKI